MSRDPCETIRNRVIDAIGSIRDPEKPCTLEELGVVSEENIFVKKIENVYHVKVIWEPTAPHCSFANNIGLCIVYKIMQDLFDVLYKLDVILKEGSHLTKLESIFYVVDKQVNDKERVAAAFENELVMAMIKDVTEDTCEH